MEPAFQQSCPSTSICWREGKSEGDWDVWGGWQLAIGAARFILSARACLLAVHFSTDLPKLIFAHRSMPQILQAGSSEDWTTDRCLWLVHLPIWMLPGIDNLFSRKTKHHIPMLGNTHRVNPPNTWPCLLRAANERSLRLGRRRKPCSPT